MCELLQKPGSLVCSISADLWQRRGHQVHKMDPSYSLLIQLKTEAKSASPSVIAVLESEDDFMIPDVISELLERSIEPDNKEQIQSL